MRRVCRVVSIRRQAMSKFQKVASLKDLSEQNKIKVCAEFTVFH